MMRWLELGNAGWQEKFGVTIQLAIGVHSGDTRGTVKLPGQPRWSAPVLHEGRVYVASESGVVSAVTPSPTHVVWQVDRQ